MLKAGAVRNKSLVNGMPLASALPRFSRKLRNRITPIVARQVMNIWCMKGIFTNIAASDHPLGANLKYRAIGIDKTTPRWPHYW